MAVWVWTKWQSGSHFKLCFWHLTICVVHFDDIQCVSIQTEGKSRRKKRPFYLSSSHIQISLFLFAYIIYGKQQQKKKKKQKLHRQKNCSLLMLFASSLGTNFKRKFSACHMNLHTFCTAPIFFRCCQGTCCCFFSPNSFLFCFEGLM